MTISFVALFFIVTSNGFSVTALLCPSFQGLIIPRGLCVSDHVVTSEFNDWESLGRRQTGTCYLGYSRQLVKKQLNHILPSKKSLNRHHEMEYHVIRLVVVFHDCPVGKDVTSEQAIEASALRSLPFLSLALHSFQAWIYDRKGTVHSQSKYKRFYSNSLLGLW